MTFKAQGVSSALVTSEPSLPPRTNADRRREGFAPYRHRDGSHEVWARPATHDRTLMEVEGGFQRDREFVKRAWLEATFTPA